MILSQFAEELALDIERTKRENGDMERMKHEIDMEAEELEISREERDHLFSLLSDVPLSH
jgi:hypothetical protein